MGAKTPGVSLLGRRCRASVEVVDVEAPRSEKLSNEIRRARGVWLDSVGEDKSEVGGWRRWTIPSRTVRGGGDFAGPSAERFLYKFGHQPPFRVRYSMLKIRKTISSSVTWK